MRSSMIALIALAAGCAQPIQPAPAAKPGHNSVETYPNLVNLAQLPPELRPKPESAPRFGPKLSHEEMAAQYECGPTCTVSIAAFVMPEARGGESEAILSGLSTERVTQLSPEEGKHLESIASAAEEGDVWLRDFAFRLREGDGAVLRIDRPGSESLRGFFCAAEPLEIRDDACRLVFAAQGTEGRPDDCAAGGRTWHVADEVNLSPGQYAAKLATSPVAGRAVVLLVGLRGVRLGQG